MNQEEFSRVIKKTIEILAAEALLNAAAFIKGGEDFEPIVAKALEASIKHFGFDVAVDYKPQSHRFPDIVLVSQAGKYGVEVKSSIAKNKSWRINGNSVMGSTREADLLATVIIFGKLVPGNCQFRAKNYEECVANVVVTHSPRYLIDMDTPTGQSFFDQSHLSYKTMVKSEKPIDLITRYFKQAGQQAWWLSDSSPAAIRFFRDLPNHEKEALKAYAFVHYPEIFSSDAKKYLRFTTWLATEQSIIDPSLRDIFSAGGKTTVVTEQYSYLEVHQIFKTLRNTRKAVIAELTNADSGCLSADWGVPVTDNFQHRKETWIRLAYYQVNEKGLAGINIKKMLTHIINE